MNRRDRLYHQPFINRPKLVLKNNKKIILWVIVNLEVWDTDLPQPRNILPPPMGVLCYLIFLIGHGMNMVCVLVFGDLLDTLKKKYLFNISS